MQTSETLTITNARCISEHDIGPPRWLTIRNGIIRRMGRTKPPHAGRTINARGNYVAAGFIDLHIHGPSVRVSLQAAEGGTTAFLRSVCAADNAELYDIIEYEKQATLSGARCLGFHIEGPFLSAAMAGAQSRKALRPASSTILRALLARCGTDIKIMTLAPELPGSLSVIRLLRQYGIVVGLGHSQATYEEAVEAINAGAAVATHVYNRMAGMTSRQPGLTAAALLDGRIAAEIIVDGTHVHPALVRLLARVKSFSRIVLVTDSVRAERSLNRHFASGVYRLSDGTIAGSRLTMLQAVKNIIRVAGIPLAQAVAMATLNPARVLGLDGRKGKIKPGYDADLVVFDNAFKCLTTIVNGKVVFNRMRKQVCR